MEKFEQKRISPDIRNLKDIYRQYLIRLQNQWFFQYPSEIDLLKDDYMEAEFLRNNGECLPLTFELIEKNNIATSVKTPVKPFYSFKRGCFYNSLSYAKTHPDVKLAYGLVIEKNSLIKSADWIDNPIDKIISRPMVAEMLLHSFCIDKNKKVIDPTLKRAENGNFHIYQIVPDKIVQSFEIKDNDSNFNAKVYVDYIEKEYESYNRKFNFKRFMKG